LGSELPQHGGSVQQGWLQAAVVIQFRAMYAVPDDDVEAWTINSISPRSMMYIMGKA
jgi:hypothetical protein